MGKSNGADLVLTCQNSDRMVLFIYLNISTDVLTNAEQSLSVQRTD
jgi:hypothetical protein